MANVTPKGVSGRLRSVDGIFLLAKQYERKNIPYELIGTNGSYRLIRKDEKLESFFSKFKNGLNPQELGFIRKVKNYVLRENIYLNFLELLNPSMIKYVDMQRHEDGVEFENIYEVDIDEAYWRAAFKLNIISKEIYDFGSKANDLNDEDFKRRKRVRLIALGALAKKSKKYVFNGKRIILEDTLRSDTVKLTENVWYSICKHVSNIMLEAKTSLPADDYLLFWVDGIYFKGEKNVKLIQEIFKNHGYESKIKKIDRVYYKNQVCHVLENLTDEKPRTFHLPSLTKKNKKRSVSIEEINRVAVKYSKK